MIVPRTAGERVRHILSKHTHGVQACGSHARIVHTLEIDLTPQVLRELTLLAGREALFPFPVCERSIDLSKVMRLTLSRPGKKVRQLTQQDVQLRSAALN